MKPKKICFNKGLALLSSLALMVAGPAFAAAPACYSSYGGYCSYHGQVEQIYANQTDTILLYFDTAMPAGEADKASIAGVTQLAAGIVKISENPDFAKLFYSTALAAQSTKRQVKIQMRGQYGGYLKMVLSQKS